MKPSTQTFAIGALTALSLALTACGGGGGDDSGTATPTTPTTPTSPTPPATYAPDLRSFAVAWISLSISEIALDVLHISGETGNCGLGGSTGYDAGAVKQALSQCLTKSSPFNVYTGGWSATSSVAGTVKTIAMSSPQLIVADASAPATTQAVITAGEVNGVDDASSDTADVYSAVAFSLDALVGPANLAYHIGSNAPGSASQSVQNGVSTLLIASATIGVNHAGNAWRFTAQNVRSVGDNRPDQGTMVITDASQATSAATTVTFGSGNVIVFASGGQSVAKHWGDADVQAALSAARQ